MRNFARADNEKKTEEADKWQAEQERLTTRKQASQASVNELKVEKKDNATKVVFRIELPFECHPEALNWTKSGNVNDGKVLMFDLKKVEIETHTAAKAVESPPAKAWFFPKSTLGDCRLLGLWAWEYDL